MDVVVVGACMSDQTCFVDRLPRSGETVVGASYQLSYGGKGANQCVMAAKLGAATTMVAKVGDDSFGRMYIDNFRANGVNCDHVTQVAGQSTGVAQICVDSAGSNTIVIVPGANQRLTVDDVTRAEPIIAQASVVVCQLEVDEATTRAALQAAKKFNVTTILNAAPAIDSLNSDIFNLVDILCVNETEAGTLLAGAPPSSESEALLAATSLLARGCRQVIITLGANGAVLVDRAHEPTHVPVPHPPARVIDTTGAGDAFVGALAYYCAARRCRTSAAAAAATSAQLLATPEIVRRACHVAAISVTAAGAQTGQPTRHQLPSCLLPTAEQLPTAADQTV